MKQKKITMDKFDLAGFTKVIVDFLDGEGTNPSYSIMTVAAPGCVPEYGPDEGMPNFLQELEAGHLLFFPFSMSNVGDPVPCADGQSRQIDDDDNSDFCIGDIDCVGFLLQLKKGIFYIDSAVNAGGGCTWSPSVDIQNCDVFDSGMEAFIDRFLQR